MMIRVLFFLKMYFLNTFFLCTGYVGGKFYKRFVIFTLMFFSTVLAFIFGFPIEIYSAAPFYMTCAYFILLAVDALFLSFFAAENRLKTQWSCRYIVVVISLFVVQLGCIGGSLWLYAHNLMTTRLYFASYPNMLPQFSEKSLVITRAWAWRNKRVGEKGLQRGDIVMFNGSVGLITRRIIALPGETLSLQEGVAVVNGVPFMTTVTGSTEVPGQDGLMVKAELRRETNTAGRSYAVIKKEQLQDIHSPEDVGIYTIPEGYVGVLSDNRSLGFHPQYKDGFIIPVETIVARPIRIITSLGQINENRLVQ